MSMWRISPQQPRKEKNSNMVKTYTRLILKTGEAAIVPFNQDHGTLTHTEALTLVNQWNLQGSGRYQYWID